MVGVPGEGESKVWKWLALFSGEGGKGWVGGWRGCFFFKWDAMKGVGSERFGINIVEKA
jgi:hypothetical protein